MTRIMGITAYGAWNAALAIYYYMHTRNPFVALVYSCLMAAAIALGLWCLWCLVLGGRTKFYAIQEDVNKWRLGRKDRLGFTIDFGVYPSEKAVQDAMVLHRKDR
jgi:hypothetical protein